MVAELPAKGLQVKLPSRRQRTRQIPVSDESSPLAHECCVAEDVIGMNVRVDDIAHRLCRHLPDRGEQGFAFAGATAGIDYRYRIVADDEACIGGVALIGGGHHVDATDVNVDAGGDLGDGQRHDRRLRLRGAPERQHQNQNHPKDVAHETQCPFRTSTEMGMANCEGASGVRQIATLLPFNSVGSDGDFAVALYRPSCSGRGFLCSLCRCSARDVKS